MASLKFWLCLFLAIVGFSSSESDSLGPCLHKSNLSAFMEIAKEVLKATMEREVPRSFEVKRQIPSGPDPHITNLILLLISGGACG
jgi:hypothetical protein